MKYSVHSNVLSVPSLQSRASINTGRTAGESPKKSSVHGAIRVLRISRLMPCVYIVCRENTDLAALIGPILLSLVNSTDVKNTDILKIRNLLRFYVLKMAFERTTGRSVNM